MTLAIPPIFGLATRSGESQDFFVCHSVEYELRVQCAPTSTHADR
ncbi:hypothetical protein ACQPZ2_35400 [Nocardia pseudovaccinii]